MAMAPRRQIGVIMAGLGGVGRAFLRLLRERFKHDAVHVVAIGDSGGYLVTVGSEELRLSQIDAVIAHKARGHGLSEWKDNELDLRQVGDLSSTLRDVKARGAMAAYIVVDCTSSPSITPVLIEAKQLGFGVAMANKHPVGGAMALYTELVGDRCPHIRYEATVGAGLPVVDVVKRVVASKDGINRIQGSLSGTMTYILSAMDRGLTFSAGLKEAHREGITEADPREDLSGADVARKMVILARELDIPVETADVMISPLLPPSAFQLSIDEFMASAHHFDEGIGLQYKQAKDAGKSLAYIGSIVPGEGISIKLEHVPTSSLFASASSTEAVVSISSEWFPEPLLMRGTAAGVESTAAAVAGDVAAIIRSIP